MKLNELLDTSVKIEVTKKEHNKFFTEAVINGRIITFEAAYVSAKRAWYVEFHEEYDHGLTKNGKEFEVFSMIKQSMEMWLKEYDIKDFHFGADKDEPSRATLYERLLKRFLGNDWVWDKQYKREYGLIFFNVKRK